MLDEDSGIFYIDNKAISLTFNETIFLSLLIMNKNKIIDYKTILKEIYNEELIENKMLSKIHALIYRLNIKIGKYVKIKKIRKKGVILEWTQRN